MGMVYPNGPPLAPLPLPEAPSPDDYTSVDTSRHQPHVISTLTASYGDVLHLEVDCPLFRMSPPELEYARDGPVIWAVLDALRPADEVSVWGRHATVPINKAGAKQSVWGWAGG